MSDADRLVAAFKTLRDGNGVTIEKLADHEYAWLLDLLLAPGDPEAGRTALEQLVTGMLDEESAWALSDLGPKVKAKRHQIPKAVRVALALGQDNEGNDLVVHGNLTQRRAWACGEGQFASGVTYFFERTDVRTHRRYEDYGFAALARLLLHRAEKSANSSSEETRDLPGHTDAKEPEPAALWKDSPGDAPERIACTDDDETTRRSSQGDARSAERRIVDRLSAWWQLGRNSVAQQWEDDKPRLIATYGAVLVVLVAACAVFAYYAIFVPTPQTADPQVVESSGAGGVGQVPPPASVKIDNTHGWGPDRKTFTSKNPAPYPVFNSITDISGHGDERNFVQCHDLADKGKPDAGWGDELIAHDQHSYECSIFFNNDVGANLDSVASPSPFIEGNVAAKLQGAHAQVIMPSPHTYNPAIVGMLTADNANPSKVWDSCNLISPQPVTVEYQAGSARMFTNLTPKDGLVFKQDIAKDGVALGEKQDGYLGQSGGYILFTIKVTLG